MGEAVTAVRLDASSPAPLMTARTASRHQRACRECGSPVSGRSEFWSLEHRRAYNNRRATRGAELYDLFMALRYDRERATELKVWRELNRLARRFRAEDVAEREARPSWDRPHEVIQRLTDRGALPRGEVLMHGRKR